MEIVNKVAQSGLITIDLEGYYVEGERILIDLKDWLFEGIILKEKDFREKIKSHDWSRYKDKFVAIFCSADAIIPVWAYMLIASELQPLSRKIVFGDLNQLDEQIFSESISKIDIGSFRDQRIVIKGCSNIHVPASAYVQLTAMLRPVVKSVMYGEPCSTVPVFKRS
jgi:hypothetical protein